MCKTQNVSSDFYQFICDTTKCSLKRVVETVALTLRTQVTIVLKSSIFINNSQVFFRRLTTTEGESLLNQNLKRYLPRKFYCTGKSTLFVMRIEFPLNPSSFSNYPFMTIKNYAPSHCKTRKNPKYFVLFIILLQNWQKRVRRAKVRKNHVIQAQNFGNFGYFRFRSFSVLVFCLPSNRSIGRPFSFQSIVGVCPKIY